MSTKTSQLIEQTLRQWDDFAAIEDEERLECIVASGGCQRIGTQAAHVMETEMSIAGPGYTVSSAWDSDSSRDRWSADA